MNNKKDSPNKINYINQPKKTPNFKFIIKICVIIFLYLYLPIIITRNKEFLLISFYSLNLLIVLALFKYYYNRASCLNIEQGLTEEKINVLIDDRNQLLKTSEAFTEKIKRYSSLKGIIEQINSDLILDSVTDKLADIAFDLIAKNKGVCAVYLVEEDHQTQLKLFKTRKENPDFVIKAKEGNIFDFWVSRHATPLLIEDIKKDFRFDVEKMLTQDIRFISSLISAPFITEHKFLGLMRLDSQQSNFYSQDDLRLLTVICDLGAVAIENALLFQKTQELAIHDSLTSFFTKAHFLERLKEEYKRSSRQNATFSLLMIDIDYFKNYNDQFGHIAGDIVLRRLALRFKETLSTFDAVISRFGGEEFSIILRGIEKPQASQIAEKLRKDIEEMKIILRRQETSVTISTGVANFPIDAKDDEELLLKADRALFKAKQEGRNRVVNA